MPQKIYRATVIHAQANIMKFNRGTVNLPSKKYFTQYLYIQMKSLSLKN